MLLIIPLATVAVYCMYLNAFVATARKLTATVVQLSNELGTYETPLFYETEMIIIHPHCTPIPQTRKRRRKKGMKKEKKSKIETENYDSFKYVSCKGSSSVCSIISFKYIGAYMHLIITSAISEDTSNIKIRISFRYC